MIELFPRRELDAQPRPIDTLYVRTYNGYVNLTLSVDEEILVAARLRAETLGSSVNQLVRDYLEQLAGRSDKQDTARQFIELSRQSTGDSNGWKFNRNELHVR